MTHRFDSYLDSHWVVEYDDEGMACSMGWYPAAPGPRRPEWPAPCPHHPLHADCDECYLSVKGWPHK